MVSPMCCSLYIAAHDEDNPRRPILVRGAHRSIICVYWSLVHHITCGRACMSNVLQRYYIYIQVYSVYMLTIHILVYVHVVWLNFFLLQMFRYVHIPRFFFLLHVKQKLIPGKVIFICEQDYACNSGQKSGEHMFVRTWKYLLSELCNI